MYFSNRRPQLKNINSPFSIEQKEGELSRYYAVCFNAAALEVQNFNKSAATLATEQELKGEHLIFSLNKDSLKDYADLLARARKYARAKEGKIHHWEEEERKNDDEK